MSKGVNEIGKNKKRRVNSTDVFTEGSVAANAVAAKVKAANKKSSTPSQRQVQTRVVKPSLNRVLVMDELNVHSVQREVWGEAKEGESAVLTNHELMQDPKTKLLYITFKPGEHLVGKVYGLTDAELDATDSYYGDDFERSEIAGNADSEGFDIYMPKKVEEKTASESSSKESS